MSAFEFQPDDDGKLAITEAVFQALGAASVCWSKTPDGEFDSEMASEIGHALLLRIGAEIATEHDQPLLGLATTGQLLDELRARIEVHGPGLGYRTVDPH